MHGTRLNRFNHYLRCVSVAALAGLALSSNASATNYPLPFNAMAGTWGWLANGAASTVVPGAGAAAASSASRALAMSPAAASAAVEVGKNAFLIGRNGLPIVAASVPLASNLIRGGAIALEVGAAVNMPLLALAVTAWALAQPSIPGSLSNLAREMGYSAITKNPDGTITLDKSISGPLGCDFNFSSVGKSYGSDNSVKSTDVCIINADGITYTAGRSYAASDYGWPGVSFPCGNSSCQTGYIWEPYASSVPKKEGGSTARVPLSDLTDQLANKKNWPDVSVLPQVIKDIANTNQPINVDQPFIEAPATDPPGTSTTTTTTNPDGTSKTTTTTNTPKVAINPSDTVTISNSSKTNSSDGTSSSTTTDQPQPETDLCKLHPDIIACKGLDVPSGEAVPKESKTVTFTPDTFSWGAGASCPAPWSFQAPVIGTTYAVSYEPFCDVASRIRPFILAGAAFVAMLIVSAGIKA